MDNYQPKVWFVTQGSTFTSERGMKFLWAPIKGSQDQKQRFYWDNLIKVKKGDIIFKYSLED